MTDEQLHSTLTWMLAELEANGLTVAKLPLHPGYIRVAITRNACWYQELCSRHLQPRRRYPKLRTYIRRRETIAALRRMLRGDRTTVYACRILEIVQWLTGESLPQEQ